MNGLLAWSVKADAGLKFDEAIAWFRARLPMTDEEFYDLDADVRRRAFSAAGLSQARMASALHSAVTKAIEEGTTIEEFREDTAGMLEAAWGGPRPWQVENIFRTNIQLAYRAGRYKQMTEPAALKRKPYWKLSVILDSRTSDICAPLAGTTLLATDKFWDTHIPPLHFECRTAIINLSIEEVEEDPLEQEGLAPDAGDAEKPLDGFGKRPDLSEWAPDISTMPEPIRRLYEAKHREG